MSLARTERGDAGQRHRDGERQQVDGVSTLLEPRPAIGREQRHPDRMQDEHERGEPRRAPPHPPEPPEPGKQEHGQEDIDREEPSNPFRLELPGTLHERGGERVPAPREDPDQPALDLGRRGRRQRSTRRGEVEGDPWRQERADDAREDRGAPRCDRPPQPDERDEEQALGPGEDREAEEEGRRRVAPGRVEHHGARHEQRGERHLHSGQRAPDERPGHRRDHAAGERERPTLRPRPHEAPGQRARWRARRRCRGPWPRRARCRRARRCRPAAASRAAPSIPRRAPPGYRRSPRPRPGCARSAGGSTSRRGETRRATPRPRCGPRRSSTPRAPPPGTAPRTRRRRARPLRHRRDRPSVARGANEGVAGVLGDPADRQHVQEAAVRERDLEQARRASAPRDPSDRRTTRAASPGAAARCRSPGVRIMVTADCGA